MKLQTNISKTIYALLGFILIAGGVFALFAPSHVVPEFTDLNDSGLKIHADLRHTFQELGSAIIALGSLLIWGIFNFDKMKNLNFILLLFFLPFAGIHWYEWIQGNRSLTSPLINSIPAFLIIVVALMRRNIR